MQLYNIYTKCIKYIAKQSLLMRDSNEEKEEYNG